MFNNSYEGADIFNFFQKEHTMTGEEIADELNCTRQNISRILKEVMFKVFKKIQRINRGKTPFEVATIMLEMLGVNQREENEIVKFFTLFPPKLRTEIEEDGERILAKYGKYKR